MSASYGVNYKCGQINNINVKCNRYVHVCFGAPQYLQVYKKCTNTSELSLPNKSSEFSRLWTRYRSFQQQYADWSNLPFLSLPSTLFTYTDSTQFMTLSCCRTLCVSLNKAHRSCLLLALVVSSCLLRQRLSNPMYVSSPIVSFLTCTFRAFPLIAAPFNVLQIISDTFSASDNFEVMLEIKNELQSELFNR